MKKHWEEALVFLETLGYLIKNYDQNKTIDLHLTTGERFSSKSSNELCTFAQRKQLYNAEFMSHMKQTLETVLRLYFNPEPEQEKSRWTRRKASRTELKPVTVYIFTDGDWQPGSAPDSVIHRLVSNMASFSNMKSHNFVGIQFIQFGNSSTGTEELTRLDSKLNFAQDIVDFEHCRGSALKMLLGSINDWFDEDEDDIDVRARRISHSTTSPVGGPSYTTYPQLRGRNTFETAPEGPSP